MSFSKKFYLLTCWTSKCSFCKFWTCSCNILRIFESGFNELCNALRAWTLFCNFSSRCSNWALAIWFLNGESWLCSMLFRLVSEVPKGEKPKKLQVSREEWGGGGKSTKDEIHLRFCWENTTASALRRLTCRGWTWRRSRTTRTTTRTQQTTTSLS